MRSRTIRLSTRETPPRGQILLGVLLSGIGLVGQPLPASAEGLDLTLRKRVPVDVAKVGFEVVEESATWDAAKTAIIVCDVWAKHWCKGATGRCAEMAPCINAFVTKARKRGALIVHAPSGGMGHYVSHPARLRAQNAPRAANLPEGIGKGCNGLESEKGAKWPIDQSDGGCDCQPRCQGEIVQPQIAAIEIQECDAISDSGVECWNLFEERGIENVVLVGVHTNMCVIGRPFGLRNMVRFGKNVALVRDLTDTMYNSRCWPYVSHFHGTDLIVEHIEKYVCPTFTSNQLLGGAPLRFREDVRPRILVVIAEPQYRTKETLPPWAEEVLGHRFGYDTKILLGDLEHQTVAGLATELAKADLLLLSLRRQALPEADLAALRSYLARGKPLLAIRTSSHALDTRGAHPAGRAEWRDFDGEVLGCDYQGHHPEGPAVEVRAAEQAGEHPVLRGIAMPFASKGSLYKSAPLAESATPLLVGSIAGASAEPVAWINAYGNAKVFYTSLGHPGDFAGPGLPQLLGNAVRWLLGATIPPAAERPE